ncbi:MAG: hypothetical protein ACI4VF_06340, partial [Lachnospirales bacterium]
MDNNKIKTQNRKIYIDKKQSLTILIGAILIFILFLSNMLYRESIPLEDMKVTGGMNNIGEISDGSAGTVMRGPYISLKKGSYNLKINYEADSDNNVKVTCLKGEGVAGQGTLSANSNEADIKFELPCDMFDSGIEFIIDYSGSGRL